jgi:hypothetical protein
MNPFDSVDKGGIIMRLVEDDRIFIDRSRLIKSYQEKINLE